MTSEARIVLCDDCSGYRIPEEPIIRSGLSYDWPSKDISGCVRQTGCITFKPCEECGAISNRGMKVFKTQQTNTSGYEVLVGAIQEILRTDVEPFGPSGVREVLRSALLSAKQCEKAPQQTPFIMPRKPLTKEQRKALGDWFAKCEGGLTSEDFARENYLPRRWLKELEEVVTALLSAEPPTDCVSCNESLPQGGMCATCVNGLCKKWAERVLSESHSEAPAEAPLGEHWSDAIVRRRGLLEAPGDWWNALHDAYRLGRVAALTEKSDK